MKFSIFANYNKVIDGFYGFVTENLTIDEMKENYLSILLNVPEENYIKLADCDLYCLGEIDNITGEIVPKKEFILHIDDVINAIAARRKALKDEQGQVVSE